MLYSTIENAGAFENAGQRQKEIHELIFSFPTHYYFLPLVTLGTILALKLKNFEKVYYSKHFRLCEPQGLSCNHSVLHVRLETSQTICNQMGIAVFQ